MSNSINRAQILANRTGLPVLSIRRKGRDVVLGAMTFMGPRGKHRLVAVIRTSKDLPIVRPAVPDPPPEPKYYADLFRRISNTLTRVLRQETDARLLFECMHRFAAKAMINVWACIDAGYLPAEMPLTLEGRRIFHKPYAGDVLIFVWKFHVLRWLDRLRPGALNPNVGQYDWPGVKHDSKGRPLGRDGKPVKFKRRVDKRGRQMSFKADQPFAHVTDDYPVVGLLRAQAGDWGEAFRLLYHLLRERAAVQWPQPSTRTRMTLSQASAKARSLLHFDPLFNSRNQKQWAQAIGCSVGLVSKLPEWRYVMKLTGRGKGRGTCKRPAVASLTSELAAHLSDGDGGGVLNELIAEQTADREPSPLEDDEPGRRPKRVKAHKRP